MPDDPQPVINWYRVLSFAVAVLSGIAAFSIVPPDVTPWLSLAAFVVSLAITYFFPGSNQAARLGDKFGKGQG